MTALPLDRPPDPLPVVVVGAGPTGVVAALALAAHGVEVVVLERHEDVYALPRAVHLDDEAARVLQSVGIADEFAGLSRPTRGLRLLDARHRTMAEFPRSTAPGRHGHPSANLFDQPDLERALRRRLQTTPSVRLRTGVEVVGVEPGPPAGPATVVLQDRTTNGVERMRAAAVLGCDGADSLVRAVVGAEWRDLRATERWLVVDVRCPEPLDAWDGVHQVCDPQRAATFLRVGTDRYRWEFALRDGESVEQLLAPERFASLVRPWTGELPVARLEVLRSSEYVFRARLADRWRRGRVLLLGDAAHQSPPFVGQGLGSGVRDAANAAWKVAAVVQGRAPEALLDTYERERRPHARALIRLARTAGWAMTGGGGRAASVRRAALSGLVRVPGAQERVLDRGTPPLARGPLVPRPRLTRRSLVGALAPQPRVASASDAGGLLDDLLGAQAAVLTTAAVDADLRRLADALGARVLRVGTDERTAAQGADDVLVDDGTLLDWLSSARVTTAVLRPDRVVLVTTKSASAPGAELARRHGDVLRLAGG